MGVIRLEIMGQTTDRYSELDDWGVKWRVLFQLQTCKQGFWGFCFFVRCHFSTHVTIDACPYPHSINKPNSKSVMFLHASGVATKSYFDYSATSSLPLGLPLSKGGHGIFNVRKRSQWVLCTKWWDRHCRISTSVDREEQKTVLNPVATGSRTHE